MYKGPMDKAKWEKDWGLEVGMAGVRGTGGGKMETTVLEQQYKKTPKSINHINKTEDKYHMITSVDAEDIWQNLTSLYY